MSELHPVRRIFCNRTLNLRSIKAIGYDMDYTLVHYRMEVWERHAYDYLKQGLEKRGWPVSDLTFDPRLSARGLIIDIDRGNVVKANRFGYVKRAFHGTRPLPFEEQRHVYSRTRIELREPRWRFLNTLFSISEACMYMQLIDKLDDGALPSAVGYPDLYAIIRQTLDGAHAEGKLKAEIIADPDRFVDLDPEMPLALLDQKHAGKTLAIITNSEWSYAEPMLTFVFDRFLPGDMTWRDLFDISFFSARKPGFFETSMPIFSIVDDTGLLREHRGPVEKGGIYVGGNASLVEESLGLEGGEILYVGDHIFTDVNVVKDVLRWRTALILRELEEELEALEAFEPQQAQLSAMMATKERMEAEYSDLRLALQRQRAGYVAAEELDEQALEKAMRKLYRELVELDGRISPLARASGSLHNEKWGLLLRTGNDKSHLARQLERYADIYTSRVSNFLDQTPFVYLRSPRGSLPHDPLRQDMGGAEGVPGGT